MIKPLRYWAASGILIGLAGCFPGSGQIPVLQDVDLVVTETATGLPVPGATVTIATAEGASEFGNADDYLDAFSADSGTTDDQGRARSTARNDAFCLVTVSVIPALGGDTCDEAIAEDRVTDVPYLIRVTLDGSSEILQLAMQPEASIAGQTYRVTIEQIGAPSRDRPPVDD